MTSFIEQLSQSAEKNKSIVCFGMDPVLEKIPVKKSTIEETIVHFYSEILAACHSSNTLPSVVKPNYAFYAQYGFDGLRALQKIINKVHSFNLPVILDAKRGDIGKTNEAYARECFDFWQADAVTVSPFLGFDSVMPFVQWCEQKGKGVYLLNRTSNKGALDFQGQMLESGKPLYLEIAQKVVEWSQNAQGNLGVVIGATSMQELEQLSRFYVHSHLKVPFLIPGVGSQGGSAAEVVSALTRSGISLPIVCINSSSELNFAWQKENNPSDFANASVRALQKLNQEIGFK